jgi:high-affinity iron transporter
MLGSAVIVFREVLEAALIISILLAATRGLPRRHWWIGGGGVAGVLGAIVVAMFTGRIAALFAGAGQEMFNAAVLFTAVLMLAWHNIWMAAHSRHMSASLKNLSASVTAGELPLYFIAVAAGLAVLREGSEVVLFLYGIAASGGGAVGMISGGLLGLAGGAAVGILLYRGLLRIPAGLLFRVTGWLILLLASGMAATAVGYLSQAGVLPSYPPLWNSSTILSEHSITGQLLHILVGYQARPDILVVLFYLVTLTFIASGMRMAARQGKRATATDR